MPLPPPSTDASAHSEQLREHMAREIASSGGWIDFAHYMELALYAPGLGYYSAGAAKLGGSGDFVTAPEISSLFGRTLARPIAQTLRSIGGDVLELGAGSGKLAVDLLSELESLNALPGTYFILELSADLRQRQQMLIRERAPRLAPRVVWLDALPNAISGVVLANEVLDALPVHIMHWTEGDTVERGVMIGKRGFAWQDRPITNPDLARRATAMRPGEDYVSEISLAVPALIHSVGRMLRHGQAVFIDYGFLHDEFYHPQRAHGTLMCHYRHRAHDDPFFLPGLQDITAHVDFTAVEEAAREAGLTVAGYSTQARFLIECGIAELLGQIDAAHASAYLPLANQVQRLTSPAEMGELFKVIVLARERG
jgi:SAM-dependent MidA family methyltransferase